MRWCALLLLAGCVGRSLEEPDVATTRVDQDLAVFASHDLGTRDLAAPVDLATHDLAVPRDAAVAHDLATTDLAPPTLDWQPIPVPNNERVSDISGWSTAVVVATQTWDESNPYAPVYKSGGVYTYDGQRWTTLLSTGPATAWPGGVEAVYAVSPTEIYATLPWFTRTDNTSVILRYDGTDWSEILSSQIDVYYRIRQLQNGDLVVATQDKTQAGVVMTYSGGTWTRISTRVANDFDAVWGNDPNDLYAAGWPKTFLHWDGTSWTDLSPGGAGRFFFAWGTGADVYFGGPNVYRYDGSHVTDVITGPDYFYDVWQAASDRAYIVGCVGPSSCTAGVIYSFDGTTWTQRDAPAGNAIERIWGRSDDDLWVSNWGVLYHHGP